MKLPKWLVGTTDGKNFVISTDRGDMPTKGMVIPVHEGPTRQQIDILERDGCNVRVVYPENTNASR
jgi:hypothetical protein